MKYKYSPQRSDNKIEYEFNGESITVTFNGQTDTFDFSSLGDGKLESVETSLEVNPIISAERVDGELKVELLYFHGADATQEELFPQWEVVE